MLEAPKTEAGESDQDRDERLFGECVARERRQEQQDVFQPLMRPKRPEICHSGDIPGAQNLWSQLLTGEAAHER